METSKYITVAGLNDEVLVVETNAYSAFCQISANIENEDGNSDRLRSLMQDDNLDILVDAYNLIEWSGKTPKGSTISMLAGHGAVMTGSVAEAFKSLIRAAHADPSLVARVAMNAAAPESLTGIRIS